MTAPRPASPIPFPNLKPATLDLLAESWRAAKRAEEDARERRLAIEVQLLEQIPAEGAEGSVSVKTDAFKITATYGVTRSVDTPTLQGAWGELPPALQNCFRWKAEVNTTELRKYDGGGLERFVTVKPAKPSVKIEVL